MGRNCMRIAGYTDEIPHYERVTRLHGGLHPLQIELEDFEAAFKGAMALLQDTGMVMKLRLENRGLPEWVWIIQDGGEDFQMKFVGTHTMGHYNCFRSDGKRYQLTEMNPKMLAAKVRRHFGFL